jgi:hypothetical protein
MKIPTEINIHVDKSEDLSACVLFSSFLVQRILKGVNLSYHTNM